jgi:hypothetical protein
MSTIGKRFLGSDSVDQTKLRLDNDSWLRARNAANNADINLIKLDASNLIQVSGALNASGAVTGTNISGSSSGTNTGDITITTVGATPAAAGASLSGQALTLQPFDSTNPGVVVASGGGTANFLRADGTWAAPTSSGANTTLSNLGVTAINADLLPDADITRSVGAVSNQMLDVFSFNYTATGEGAKYTANNGTSNVQLLAEGLTSTPSASDTGLAIKATTASLAGNNAFAIFTQNRTGLGNGSGHLIFETGNTTSSSGTGYISLLSGAPAGSGTSGAVSLTSGNSASGNSGNVSLTVGSAGGTQGEIVLFKTGVASVIGDVWTATGTAGEGYWTAPASSGTVTSVAASVPAFLSVSGSPITSSGTLAISLSGTALPLANGGTGETSASAAINALVPTQTGNSGKRLSTNGTVVSWADEPIHNKELFVLVSGDITNQYIDLAHVAKTNSIDFVVKGGGIQIEGASYDYSVSYTGGAGGNTRITFLNDLATGGPSALVATDVVVVKYQY